MNTPQNGLAYRIAGLPQPTKQQKPTGLEDISDIGIAKLFASKCKDILRFIPERDKWFYFDGKHWTEDLRKKRIVIFSNFIDWLLKNESDLDNYKKISRYKNKKGISDAFTVAEAFAYLLFYKFDTNPFLLNLKNGTYDLKSNQLNPHNNTDYITQLSSVKFDQNAKCPIWEKSINDWTCGDKELADWLQAFTGYCLSGLVGEEIFPIFYGTGKNGKSVFVNVLSHLLGDYWGTISQGTLMDKEQHPTGIASCFGKRFISCNETDQVRLNEAKMKMLTSTNKITARKMRENFWEFVPTHKLVMSTNNRPIIVGQDEGVWRRVKKVSWNFYPTVPNLNLENELKGELSGILNWAISGWKRYQNEGLPQCTAIELDTNAYRHDSDLAGMFLEDCFIMPPQSGQKTPTGEVKSAFNLWCNENNIHTRTPIPRLLETKEIYQKKSGSVRYYPIALLPEISVKIGY